MTKYLANRFVLDKLNRTIFWNSKHIFSISFRSTDGSDERRIDEFVLFIIPERFLSNFEQELIKVPLYELQKLRIYSIDIRIFDVAEKFFSSWRA